jgi:hypothetical protein
MNANPEVLNADKIRKIAELALQDALQIVHLIELLRAQNSRGINARVSKAGGSQAVVALRNAMIGYLTLLVAREGIPLAESQANENAREFGLVSRRVVASSVAIEPEPNALRHGDDDARMTAPVPSP